ncbi:MAG TPA: class I SAM-dependent methyltransferase [Gaiellaceae bacterium]|nr:class I SAM-dependent methyltransferase [Gaiellaceae bacterium]
MKEYYERRAPTYDDWYLGHGRYAVRDMEAWAADLAGLIATIGELEPCATVDVACGTGFLTRHLPETVTGLDQSASMLEIATRQAPGATFVQGDALELPFDDASFDRVFTGHFYGHLDAVEGRRFLGEAERVARELVVVDAAVRPDHELEEVQHREVDGETWPVLKRYFAPETLLQELGGGEILHAGPWFVMARRVR